MKLILAAVFALLAAPVFAADPATVTCKDMMAMDAKGMADTGTALKGAMKDDAKVAAMADVDVTTAAGAACTAHPEGTVMEAMKTSMMATDPGTLTCKDMLAMGPDAMLAAGISMKIVLKDDASIMAMSDADVSKAAGVSCTAHPDVLVVDALKMK